MVNQPEIPHQGIAVIDQAGPYGFCQFEAGANEKRCDFMVIQLG